MSIKNLPVMTACLIFLSLTGTLALAQVQETESQESWQASREHSDAATKRRPDRIYYERKVPEYSLPNPLIMANGTKVVDAERWSKKRRPEIVELFRKHVYGRAPVGRPKEMTFKVFDLDHKALNGLAVRRQVTVDFTGRPDGPSMDILIYLPAAVKEPVPTFVLLNFHGNHAIHPDPAIKLSSGWMRGQGRGVVNNRATEDSRGSYSARFPVEEILRRGYGLARHIVGTLTLTSTTVSRTAYTRHLTS